MFGRQESQKKTLRDGLYTLILCPACRKRNALLVIVNGVCYALGRGMAMKIMVEPNFDQGIKSEFDREIKPDFDQRANPDFDQGAKID